MLNNLYREYYDIPNNLRVRKADDLMRIAVDTSETLKKVEKLQQRGLHPSLIFFSHDLYDNQVSRIMQILHGTNIDKEKRSNKHT